MNMTASQYQKQLDDAGYLEAAAEQAEKDCRSRLMDLQAYHYQERISAWAKGWRFVGDQQLNDALLCECRDDLDIARSLLDSNPVEAMRILDDCRKKAVEDVIGRMDFERIATDELDDRSFAA